MSKLYLVDGNIIASFEDLTEVNAELCNPRFTKPQIIALLTINENEVLSINDFTITKFKKD